MELNYSIIPMRPAGGAWSNVRDMLTYVSMELAEGKLPDGKRYISKEALLARRAPQVPIGKDATYGMGLMVDTKYGVPVVHHGGDMIGFHSDMMWLPEHNVGAVILTNGDPGWIDAGRVPAQAARGAVRRPRPRPTAKLARGARRIYEELAAERKLLTVPADAAEAGKLAPRYRNAALGDIAVSHDRAATVFDFGEWKSEVASRKNPDGTVSFVTIAPGVDGLRVRRRRRGQAHADRARRAARVRVHRDITTQ